MIVVFILSTISIVLNVILCIYMYNLYKRLKNIPNESDIINKLQAKIDNNISDIITQQQVINNDLHNKLNIYSIKLNTIDNAVKILNTGFVIPTQSYM